MKHQLKAIVGLALAAAFSMTVAHARDLRGAIVHRWTTRHR